MDIRYTPPKDAIIYLTDRSDVMRSYRLRHFKRKYPTLVGGDVLQKGLAKWLASCARSVCNKTLHSVQIPDIQAYWPRYKECAIEFERFIRFGCAAYAGTIEWCTGMVRFEELILKDFDADAFHKSCWLLDNFIHHTLPTLRFTQEFKSTLRGYAPSVKSAPLDVVLTRQ